MAVTQDRPAPYAPTSVILSLIERHRNRGLPTPVDASVLERAGVSPSLIPRTLQAIQTLDLIGDDGRPSDALEAIRLAPEAEYKVRLSNWLTTAYADALQYVDPATATETDIRDAFRKYMPFGQQDRMVSLFIGLFTAAGVMPPRETKPATRKPSAFSGPKMRVLEKARTKPASMVKPVRHYGGGGATDQFSGLPPALAGLLQSLPTNGEGWTQDRRDAFIATFGAVIDFCFPIREQEPPPDDFTDEATEGVVI